MPNPDPSRHATGRRLASRAALAILLLGVTFAAPRAQAPTLLMEEMTWTEIQARLAAGVDTAVLAVGATEQHGPQIALASDSVTGDHVGPAVAARLGRALVAPNIRIGVSPHHMMFPGTITVRTEVLGDLIREYVHSLAWHGFRHIVIVPTHGGNFTTVGRVAAQLGPLYPHVNVVGYSDADSYIAQLTAASQRLGIPLAVAGSHAGLSETAMILAIRPELVRPDASEAGFMGDAYGMGERMNREGTQAISPIGVLGDPRGATAAAGRGYLEGLVNHLAGFAAAARERWQPAAPTELPYGGLPDPTGPLADAVRLRRAGRYDDALAALAAPARAGDPALAVEIARTYVLAGRFAAARQQLQPLLASADPRTQELAHDELTYIDLYSGRFADAVEHKRAARALRAAAGDRRGEAHKLFYIGHIQTEIGDLDAAEATYGDALLLAPTVDDTHLDVQHQIGLVHVARGNLVQAGIQLRVLEDAVLQPAFAAHVRRFYHLQGEVLLARGRHPEAIANIAPAIRIYDHPLYREALARAFAGAGRLEDAAAEYRRLLELTDARLDVPILYVEAHAALARLYDRMGRRQEADALYRAFLTFWESADRRLPSVVQVQERVRVAAHRSRDRKPSRYR